MSENGVNDDLLGVFLDDELSDQDIDRLLDTLDCEHARGRACRQSIAARAISGGTGACVDISAAVRTAIAQESNGNRVVDFPTARAQTRSPRSRSKRWRVPATGMALAASAALAAMIVIKPEASVSQPAVDVASVQATPMLAQGAESDAAVDSEDLLAVMSRQAQLAPAQSYSIAPVQRVSAGTNASASSVAGGNGRELVIQMPETERAVQAQWSLIGQADQNELAERRLQQQLNSMLINHARFGGGSAIPGALGYARVTAQGQQKQN